MATIIYEGRPKICGCGKALDWEKARELAKTQGEGDPMYPLGGICSNCGHEFLDGSLEILIGYLGPNDPETIALQASHEAWKKAQGGE